jgi:hypothetical protein
METSITDSTKCHNQETTVENKNSQTSIGKKYVSQFGFTTIAKITKVP